MRAHVIENGVVVNTIVVDSLDALPGLIEEVDGVEIGWSYVDGEFVDLRPAPEPTSVEPTKEELLAQLQALQAQITSLGE